jgi:hypothetical protein
LDESNEADWSDDCADETDGVEEVLLLSDETGTRTPAPVLCHILCCYRRYRFYLRCCDVDAGTRRWLAHGT